MVEATPEHLLSAITLLQATSFTEDVKPSIRIAIAGLKTLREIYALLSMFRITVADLRRRFGIPAQNKDRNNDSKNEDIPAPDAVTPPADPEKQAGDSPPTDKSGTPKADGDGDGKPKKGRDKHGRRGKEDFPDAKQRYFAQPDFDHHGCHCPECLRSSVYLMGAVGGGIRFVGQPHLAVTGIHKELWRCGDCGAHFPAPLAADIINDGGNSRMGYSAAATIAAAKYLYGTPWARQESQGSLLDLHIPATTQWEHTLSLTTAALPVYRHLFCAAAPASLFYSDDTGARIIGVTTEDKTQRTTGKTVTRTGVHTSCVVAMLTDGRRINIYKTGIIHAGELLDEILKHRSKDLPRPYHMSDGHSANPPTVCSVIAGDCNSHARRKVEEKQGQWAAVWRYIESVYKAVYKTDAKAKKLSLSPEQRLALHRQESLPLMKAMFVWMQQCLDDKTVEPNSGLGGVFEYFLIRERGLTAFCRYPGFPIDNNLCEQSQKLVAQHRKNAEYFRTQRGAEAADVIMSLGATAKHAGVNAHHYFVALQRYKDEVKATPENFLPWNYLETIKQLEILSPPPRRVLEVSEAEFMDRQQRLHSKKAWGRPAAKPVQKTAAAAQGP